MDEPNTTETAPELVPPDPRTRHAVTAILRWWFEREELGPDLQFRMAWFTRSEAFDEALRERFGELVEEAFAHPDRFLEWRDDAFATLALLLLYDQFPRNLFRGSARAFASDGLAREVASRAVDAGLDRQVPLVARSFFYLPFEHSEELSDQRRSVALFEALVEEARAEQAAGRADEAQLSALVMAHDYAVRHLEVIERFGRFPHRNSALGRATTEAEQAWLDAGGGF